MPMDPATMMMLLSVFSNGMSAFTGNEGEHGSTYSDKAKSTLDEALDVVKGMKGNADITKNPTYQAGNQWIQDLYNDPNFFNKFEAPLMRQFNEEIIPELGNRFAAMGSGGALGSTSFRNQLAREGSNLSTNIAALRGNMQQQGANQALQYAQQPVSNYQSLLNTAITPTQNTYQPPSAGPWGGISSAATSGAIQAYINKYINSGASPSTQPGYQAQYPMTNYYSTGFKTGEFG